MTSGETACKRIKQHRNEDPDEMVCRRVGFAAVAFEAIGEFMKEASAVHIVIPPSPYPKPASLRG